MSSPRVILLATCRDQKGIVATLANFIYENGGNITDVDQHRDPELDLFCTRIEWELEGFHLKREEIEPAIQQRLQAFHLRLQLAFSDVKPRLSIWVSKQEHCLLDLLGRLRAGDLRADVALIVSNHPDLADISAQFSIPFVCLPIDQENKAKQEKHALHLLKQHRVDCVILAKYMQVLSQDFLHEYSQLINIHHSFLPAFPGSQPYHQAHRRGVKVIGATAHYVTEALDDGPIIEQGVERVSHRDSIADLIRKGKDMEKWVLARAVYLHVESRILVYGNKTVVFE